MITESQARELCAQIQKALPEDTKFQLIVARANLDEGGVDFMRLTELPKEGANLMLREYIKSQTVSVFDDFSPSED